MVKRTFSFDGIIFSTSDFWTPVPEGVSGTLVLTGAAMPEYPEDLESAIGYFGKIRQNLAYVNNMIYSIRSELEAAGCAIPAEEDMITEKENMKHSMVGSIANIERMEKKYNDARYGYALKCMKLNELSSDYEKIYSRLAPLLAESEMIEEELGCAISKPQSENDNEDKSTYEMMRDSARQEMLEETLEKIRQDVHSYLLYEDKRHVNALANYILDAGKFEKQMLNGFFGVKGREASRSETESLFDTLEYFKTGRRPVRSSDGKPAKKGKLSKEDISGIEKIKNLANGGNGSKPENALKTAQPVIEVVAVKPTKKIAEPPKCCG